MLVYSNITNETFTHKVQNNFSLTCEMEEAHLIFIVVIFLSGVISNILLVLFVAEQRAPKLSPDKILILNLAATNLLGLLVSLPLHIIHIIQQEYVVLLSPDGFCLVIILSVFSLFLCFSANTINVSAIAFDRSDALKNLPHQRKLTSKRVKRLVMAMWTVPLIITCIAFLLKFPKAGNLGNRTLCLDSQLEQNSRNTVRPHGLGIIIFVLLWVVPSSFLTVFSLASVTNYIRKHRQKIESMFGPRKAATEIDFTKISFAFVLSYVLTWAPFGVVAMIGEQSSCVLLWTKHFAYMGFVLIPIVYMVMDKRFWATMKNRLKCNWVCPCSVNRTEDFNQTRAQNRNGVPPGLVVAYRKTWPLHVTSC